MFIALGRYIIKRHKIKNYILTIIFLFSSPIYGNYEDNNLVNIVEIANFQCPDCYQAHKKIFLLKKLVRTSGGIFNFFPISWEPVSPWPSIAYLSMPEIYRDQVEEAFFNALQINGQKLETPQSACFIVSKVIPLSLEECMKEIISKKAVERTQNGEILLDKIGAKNRQYKLPIFILESKNKIISVLSLSDFTDIEGLISEASELVKKLVRKY